LARLGGRETVDPAVAAAEIELAVRQGRIATDAIGGSELPDGLARLEIDRVHGAAQSAFARRREVLKGAQRFEVAGRDDAGAEIGVAPGNRRGTAARGHARLLKLPAFLAGEAIESNAFGAVGPDQDEVVGEAWRVVVKLGGPGPERCASRRV